MIRHHTIAQNPQGLSRPSLFQHPHKRRVVIFFLEELHARIALVEDVINETALDGTSAARLTFNLPNHVLSVKNKDFRPLKTSLEKSPNRWRIRGSRVQSRGSQPTPTCAKQRRVRLQSAIGVHATWLRWHPAALSIECPLSDADDCVTEMSE